MDELYGNGPFANGGSTALDGTVANIAGNEDPRHARFQQIWIAL
jgi:hypothetical protein